MLQQFGFKLLAVSTSFNSSGQSSKDFYKSPNALTGPKSELIADRWLIGLELAQLKADEAHDKSFPNLVFARSCYNLFYCSKGAIHTKIYRLIDLHAEPESM